MLIKSAKAINVRAWRIIFFAVILLNTVTRLPGSMQDCWELRRYASASFFCGTKTAPWTKKEKGKSVLAIGLMEFVFSEHFIVENYSINVKHGH